MDVDARIRLFKVTGNDCERLNSENRETSKQFIRDLISKSSGYAAPSASACFHGASVQLAVCYWRRDQFCYANDRGAQSAYLYILDCESAENPLRTIRGTAC